MKKLKTKKQLILVLLIGLTMAINLNFLVTTIKAGPYVPEEHANNGWHWGVDVEDELYFELEIITANATSGEVTMMFRDIWIYNITSIENVTLDWLGTHNFSQVSATQCFYNLTSEELEPLDDPYEFALFGYNNSDDIKHRYRAGESLIPNILPLNGSNNLEVDVLAPILNETLFYPLSQEDYNYFNAYSYNIGDNSITFTNSTDDYYIYNEYDSADGTLQYSKGYILANMEEPTLINMTLTRVPNYNITDEIEWGVEVGDIIYYDYGEIEEGEGSYYSDVKVVITDISNVMLEKSFNSFSEESIQMIFQAVYANLSFWEGTSYEIEEEGIDFIIGCANNFYFQYFDAEPSEFNILFPSNTIRADIEFIWNPNTLNIWETPFDEIDILENGNFEFILRDSSSVEQCKTIIEKSTGIVQSFLMVESEKDVLYYEIKSMTLVEWDVEIGDVVYYKENSEDGETYIRATIILTDGEFFNMTEMELESNGIFTKIPGQPELQFFKVVVADIGEFNITAGTWQYKGDYLFLEANTYWPISPNVMFEGDIPPLFIPEDFTGEDFEDLYGSLESVFDNITYTSDHINLRNSTVDKEYNVYLEVDTGRITYMGGWMNNIGGNDTDWFYISAYPMYNETLESGTNNFSVPSDAVSEITTCNIEIVTNNTGIEALNALLAHNPTNTSITNGTVLYYSDLLITNSTGLANLTFYIKFDSTFDLNNYNLTFWAWNMSGNNEWEEAPPEEVADIIDYDYADNSLTIYFPVEGRSEPLSIIIAVSHIYIGPDPSPPPLPGGIPGYPLLLTLGILSIGLIALIVIHLKKVKKF
jgi:hypothetical protein